jgi:murein DD-endopeptidase MepM/ murein hydrolase activator NlpD/outer membrane biosynthesis protein TonB
MDTRPKRAPAQPAPASRRPPGRRRSTRIVALGLLGTGLYGATVATGADAQAPAPVVTPSATPEATPTPTSTPEPPEATPTPTPTPTPEATPTPAPTPEATPTPQAPPTPEPAPTPAPRDATPPPATGPADATATTPLSPQSDHGRDAHKPAGTPRRNERGDRPGHRNDRSSRPARTDDGKTAGDTTRRAASAPAPSSVSAPGDPLIGSPLPATDPWGAAASIGVPGFFIESFRIPPFLLPIYQAAAARYGIPWEVLAAINEIETDYGRNAGVSSAGAVGWMQFLPSTWKRYGVDANRDGVADPSNPVDAVFAAARYLRAAGADRDLTRAVFAYNHSDAYVHSVLGRARLIAGEPRGLIAALTGLAQGRFPVAARATYRSGHADSRIFARAGAAVVAVSDGRIVSIGRTRQLGRFVRLEDIYGNTYTYARLRQLGQRRKTGRATTVRLFAHRAHGIRFTKLRPGTIVVAGTILGRIGRTHAGRPPHALFRIRPAGRRTPPIDPAPILDGWRLLRAAGRLPSGGEDVWRMSAQALAARVLADPRVHIYECGRRDIRAGEIDRRVLATLEYLAASGLDPTVSALKCGHSLMTSSGNVSEHSTGSAVDISALNGIPIAGHQGPGSITERAVHRLLTLQGVMRPHQIITLMRVDGAANTFAMADHADHIHIGWRPQTGAARGTGALPAAGEATLNPRQWMRLIDRLRKLANPRVHDDLTRWYRSSSP